MFPDYSFNNHDNNNKLGWMIKFILISCIFISSRPNHICLAQIFTSSTELDTTTEDPLLSCDPPWRGFNSKCYFTTTRNPGQLATLPLAKQTCKRAGGDLAKPSSDEEHTFIRRILNSYDATWIGATDNDKKNWLDGTPMLYTNFDDNINNKELLPSASSSTTTTVSNNDSFPLCGSHCCGLTTNRDGKWNYSSCDTFLHFVCVKTNETINAFRLSTAKKQSTSLSSSSTNSLEADNENESDLKDDLSTTETHSKPQADVGHTRQEQSKMSSTQKNRNSNTNTNNNSSSNKILLSTGMKWWSFGLVYFVTTIWRLQKMYY